MAQPTAERHPKGLDAYWLGVWRHALKVMKDQKTWTWEQRPLLDEYVFALKAAEQARVGFGWLDHLMGVETSDEVDFIALKQIATGLPVQWDRHTKRATALADVLLLTERSRKAHGLGIEGADEPAAEDDWSSIYGDDNGASNVTQLRRSS